MPTLEQVELVGGPRDGARPIIDITRDHISGHLDDTPTIHTYLRAPSRNADGLLRYIHSTLARGLTP